MDYKDVILHQTCPTVMVPKYSPLQDICAGYRYLMAEDGLWIEAKPAWGQIRLPIWKSPRALPYGLVEELISLEGGAIPHELLRSCILMATERAIHRLEWGGWIVWNRQSGYSFLDFSDVKATFSSLKFSYPELREDATLVMDLHSHPFNMPTFSEVDDHDDMGGVKFSGVVSFNKGMEPNLKIRLCVEGHFFEMEDFNNEALSSK